MDDVPGGALELDCILVGEPIMKYEFVHPPATGDAVQLVAKNVPHLVLAARLDVGPAANALAG